MTTDELIKFMQQHPGKHVMFAEGCCLMDVSSATETAVNDHHAQNSGDAEDRLGETVISLHN